MVMTPMSSNSSLRSLTRSAVSARRSTARRWRTGSTRGTANQAARAAAPRSVRPLVGLPDAAQSGPPVPLLAGQRDVQAIDAEREADRGQRAAEAAEQVVVAARRRPSARRARGHRPRTARRCSSRGCGPARGRRSSASATAGSSRSSTWRMPADRVGHRAGGAGEHVGAAAPLGHADEQLRLLGVEPEARRRRARARRSPGRASAVEQPRAHLLGHAETGHQRRVQRSVAEPDAIALQPGGVEGVAQHGRAPRRCRRAPGADQLDSGLEELSRLAALRTDAAVAVGEVAEAQRRLGGRDSASRSPARSAPSCPSAARALATARRTRGRPAARRPCPRAPAPTRTRAPACSTSP